MFRTAISLGGFSDIKDLTRVSETVTFIVLTLPKQHFTNDPRNYERKFKLVSNCILKTIPITWKNTIQL